MSEFRDRVTRATLFSKLDLQDGYYLVRMKEGEVWKTVFRPRYELFEYTVMLSMLTDAPSTFQNKMKEVL